MLVGMNVLTLEPAVRDFSAVGVCSDTIVDGLIIWKDLGGGGGVLEKKCAWFVVL
jgi:hypothetical protein